MARYKDVEFSNGETVRIYAPPTQQIRALVEKRYPKPLEPVPPVTKEKGVTGREIVMTIEDDPAYLEALAVWKSRDLPAWENLIAEETDRRGSLFVFKDLKVPEDWDVEAEVGVFVRLDEPDWEPTPGEQGRKRDYIQWELLSDPEDAILVQRTLLELTGIPLEEVNAFMASFRPEMEGEAA